MTSLRAEFKVARLICTCLFGVRRRRLAASFRRRALATLFASERQVESEAHFENYHRYFASLARDDEDEKHEKRPVPIIRVACDVQRASIWRPIS